VQEGLEGRLGFSETCKGDALQGEKATVPRGGFESLGCERQSLLVVSFPELAYHLCTAGSLALGAADGSTGQEERESRDEDNDGS